MVNEADIWQRVQPSTPARPNAAIYAGTDVVGDPDLTTADKRAILESWVFDSRAAENAPTLRRLDSGAVVEVGAILEALRLLDRSISVRSDDLVAQPLRRRSGVFVRLPMRAATPTGSGGDDDPPPTPVG